LSFLIGRSRPGSRLAAVLGNGFTIVVSLYLVVLTGSLFMLALHTPDSGIERFDAQLEASDQLTSEMHDASARIDALIARIDRSSAQIDGLEQLVDDQSAKRTVVKVPSASVVDLRRIGDLSSAHLPVIADLQANLASLRAEVRQIEGRQPSMLWKSFVGIAAAVVLGLAIAGLYEVFAK
jgi:hypothetical protein